MGKAGDRTICTNQDKKGTSRVPPDGLESSLPPFSGVSGILGTIGVHEASGYIATPERSDQNISNPIEVYITSRTDEDVTGEAREGCGKQGGRTGGSELRRIRDAAEVNPRRRLVLRLAAHLQDFHSLINMHGTRFSSALHSISSIRTSSLSISSQIYLHSHHSIGNCTKMRATIRNFFLTLKSFITP